MSVFNKTCLTRGGCGYSALALTRRLNGRCKCFTSLFGQGSDLWLCVVQQRSEPPGYSRDQNLQNLQTTAETRTSRPQKRSDPSANGEDISRPSWSGTSSSVDSVLALMHVCVCVCVCVCVSAFLCVSVCGSYWVRSEEYQGHLIFRV